MDPIRRAAWTVKETIYVIHLRDGLIKPLELIVVLVDFNVSCELVIPSSSLVR